MYNSLYFQQQISFFIYIYKKTVLILGILKILIFKKIKIRYLMDLKKFKNLDIKIKSLKKEIHKKVCQTFNT